MMKFKVDDRIISRYGHNSYYGIIKDVSVNTYLIYWSGYNRTQTHTKSIEDAFIVDKEYMWNEQIKEIINE